MSTGIRCVALLMCRIPSHYSCVLRGCTDCANLYARASNIHAGSTYSYASPSYAYAYPCPNAHTRCPSRHPKRLRGTSGRWPP